MFKIGCHLSVSKGFENMGKIALSIGANTFQFFTRNPQGGSKAKDIDPKDTDSLIDLMIKNNFGKIIAHAPYTLNACSANDRTRAFAKIVMKDDITRMEYLPGNFYNFHPGSHVGQGVEAGIDMIASLLNEIITPKQSTIILLETMSGKGSEIGKSFEEIRDIINKVKIKNKIGVCFDTCHVNDAGYDIINNLDKVLDEFDQIIGLEKLYAVHLNDSINSVGSHKDRHQKIGEGEIGIEAISKIINHPKLSELPFVLETPNDISGYKKEISTLKKLRIDKS